jgi:hypothetical protein
VVLVKSYNLSVDLGPDFKVSNATFQFQENSIVQQVNITNFKISHENATVLVYSYPKKVEPTKYVRFMENLMIATMELVGSQEIGTQSVDTRSGQNVTIHMLTEKGSLFYISIWSIDELNYLMLISYFDQSTTEKIVQTLELKP